jgi:hypothetical protein
MAGNVVRIDGVPEICVPPDLVKLRTHDDWPSDVHMNPQRPSGDTAQVGQVLKQNLVPIT